LCVLQKPPQGTAGTTNSSEQYSSRPTANHVLWLALSQLRPDAQAQCGERPPALHMLCRLHERLRLSPSCIQRATRGCTRGWRVLVSGVRVTIEGGRAPTRHLSEHIADGGDIGGGDVRLLDMAR